MLWRPAEHEPLSESEWDEAAAREAVAAIVADAEGALEQGFWPNHPLDDLSEDERPCSLYLGSGGMAWALWKLGSGLDAAKLLTAAIERYRLAPDEGADAHPPSFLVGESGLLAAAQLIDSPAADRERLRRLVHENREDPAWEVLYGSPGRMIAARACGLPDEWRESARLAWEHRDEVSGLWTQRLGPHVARCLGAAHGFAGNANVLRGSVSDEVLRQRVSAVLERTAAVEDGLANWPVRDQPLWQAPGQIRVQWCHGAPGIVCTVADLIPRKLALAGGELVWRAGPLRKGPGLCHGTAGNGYAFLRLHALTGDSMWLERARRFAMHAAEQVVRMRTEYGRGRYTLMTGDIGAALYLDACLRADPAFPVIDGLG